MAISGKPQKAVTPPSPALVADEETVRKLINKGGSVADTAPTPTAAKAKPMLVQLRLLPSLLEEIDARREGANTRRRKPTSRHEWIVQAIEEKLDREGKR